MTGAESPIDLPVEAPSAVGAVSSKREGGELHTQTTGETVAGDGAEVGEEGYSNEGEMERTSLDDVLKSSGAQLEVKRVDKDRTIIGDSSADEMRDAALKQQRMEAVWRQIKDLGRSDKMKWASDKRHKANKLYQQQKFKQAIEEYSDCLLALDFGKSEAEARDCQEHLQLPVVTNLAACMLETNENRRCIALCDTALSIDPRCIKARFRRGVAHHRLCETDEAQQDFVETVRLVDGLEEAQKAEESHLQLKKRASVYLDGIQRRKKVDKAMYSRMFAKDKPLYPDKPSAGSAASGPSVWRRWARHAVRVCARLLVRVFCPERNTPKRED
ncbi:unnamed protein product [Vitrella brassicaformis CCMP3155]|uniref:Uncharacterized protein n=2 Tax=Vitrella brassicaformis TaxID=1169539 RepID=A0A0G4EY38_VITBC|nr:unnamed protein product [Vitrella brassicaformis CCMP3155]|eukprot:CEM03340.1 unnamed protein product [Vitrella brassicaformis CCMP3155]